MITLISPTKIIKGCVKLPSDLRMKYKMYEYSPVTFVEMEDGIMIRPLISNTENGVKRTIGNKVVTKYPDLEKELITVMQNIEAFSR